MEKPHHNIYLEKFHSYENIFVYNLKRYINKVVKVLNLTWNKIKP